jgi:hypothetical protein
MLNRNHQRIIIARHGNRRIWIIRHRVHDSRRSNDNTDDTFPQINRPLLCLMGNG